MPESTLRLVWPSAGHLPTYVAALERGWSPDNIRGAVAAQEELERIAQDADGFLASRVDREGRGPLVTMPDGTQRKRLPGFYRWLWDGEFAGSINLRWQPGTSELPPHVLGHIGYAVPEWKQRRGYATRGLAMLLDDARGEGLAYVYLTTDEANAASRRVIEANGGALVGHFTKPPEFGSKPSVKYRIELG